MGRDHSEVSHRRRDRPLVETTARSRIDRARSGWTLAVETAARSRIDRAESGRVGRGRDLRVETPVRSRVSHRSCCSGSQPQRARCLCRDVETTARSRIDRAQQRTRAREFEPMSRVETTARSRIDRADRRRD